MKPNYKKDISRRDFLKLAGTAGLAGAGLASCGNRDNAAPSAATGEIPTDQMTYRTTPTTGDHVSLLGYGCMRWPTLPGEDEAVDQEAVNELVDFAMTHGVNYFDTSPVYCKGESERIIGIALKRHPRESFYIATKLSNFAPGTRTHEASIAMYRESFRELQVDYIDYYLLHGVGLEESMNTLRERFIDNGVLDFLLEERRAGRIRNLGFSYHGDVKVFDWLLSQHERYQWDFVQIQLNYLDWHHAKEINPRNTDADYLYTELAKLGIPAVIMEPLLGGRLSKVHDHIVARFKQREPGRSVASWAFRFAGTLPGVLTALSGMNYMEHLQDNLRTYSPLQPLTSEEQQFLSDTADLMMQYPSIPCNDCKYCMPCPYGINIPAILLHYNKCVNEGNLPESSQAENYREARRAFLVRYDRSVPRLRQASHCIGCNQCSVHCPQNIDIPKELRLVDSFVEKLKQGIL